MRAPSQIYKWVSHNEYDDTKQKYSSVSSGNSHNLIYSILLRQMHYRNVLCSKRLLNHLWKNSEIDVGKSAFEQSKAKKKTSKAMLLWYVASFKYIVKDVTSFLALWLWQMSVFTWMLSLTSHLTEGRRAESYHRGRKATVSLPLLWLHALWWRADVSAAGMTALLMNDDSGVRAIQILKSSNTTM